MVVCWLFCVLGFKEINAFLRHLRDLSGRRRLNWPELLLRHAHICEQRERRRREEKKRAREEAQARQDQPTVTRESPLAESAAQAFQGECANIRQLATKTVGGVVPVSGGQSGADPQTLAALANLATGNRVAAPPLKEKAVENTGETSAQIALTKQLPVKTEIQGTAFPLGSFHDADDEKDLAAMIGGDPSTPALHSLQKAADRGVEEQRGECASPTASLGRQQNSWKVNDTESRNEEMSWSHSGVLETSESDKTESRSANRADEVEGGSQIASSPISPSKKGHGQTSQPEAITGDMVKDNEKAFAQLETSSVADQATRFESNQSSMRPGPFVATNLFLKGPKATDDTVVHTLEDKEDEVEEHRSHSEGEDKPSGNRSAGTRIPPVSRMDSEALERFSWDSGSDAEADEAFLEAAKNKSQPQANPLMDAFPGRAVFLQIDPQEGSRTVM